MKSLSFLSALALTFCILLSPVCVQCLGAEEIDIPKAVADADLILIGKIPVAFYIRPRAGKTRPGAAVAGYTIEAERFFKGAVQHPSHPSHRGADQVSIKLIDFSKKEKESLRLPQSSKHTPSYIYFLRLKRAGYHQSPREKPLSPDKWFLPATAENIKAVKSNLPKPEEWGDESEGLRLGIRPLKSSYFSDESIVIELYIQNVSDRIILIPQHRLWSSDYYPFTHFSGRPYVEFEKPLGIGQKRALPPVSLTPGHIYSESIRLDSWQWGTSDGLCPFRSGTALKIKAYYDTRSIPDELRFLALEKDRLWKGFLTSPYIDLKFEGRRK